MGFRGCNCRSSNTCTCKLYYAPYRKSRYGQLDLFSILDTIFNCSIISFWTFSFFILCICTDTKKYAGLLVFLPSTIFISLGAYQHYIDDGILRNQYIVRYSGFVICLVIGFLVSHKLFKQNNWTSNGQKASR